MTLKWLDPKQLDDRDVAGTVALIEAGRRLDQPYETPPTPARFRAEVTHGWDGDPLQTAVYRDDGRIIGLLTIHAPTWDNRHLASVEVLVDPVCRRRGLGRRLFEAGVSRAHEQGRTVVITPAQVGTPGQAFVEAMGMSPASQYVRRGQDLTEVDWSALESKLDQARAKGADYDVVRMPGAIPDDLLDQMVSLTAAINDAPTDDLKLEDEVFTAERMRAYEQAQAARGQRLYRVAARHRHTGELAGHTAVAVDMTFPGQAEQEDTSVARAHRGHRLGYRLKAEMLLWLREAEPQLREIRTVNAASNRHMIAVNEELGYRVLATGIEYQKELQV